MSTWLPAAEPFLGVERWRRREVYDVVVLAIPSAASSLAPSRADRGPGLIRQVSQALRRHEPSRDGGWYEADHGRRLCGGLRIADAGDIVPVGGADRPMDLSVREHLAEVRQTCRLLVALVGDDSWTYEVVAGARGRLLHLDAHEDRNPHRPTGIDHANVMSRVLEDSPHLRIGQWGRRGISPVPPDPSPPRYHRLRSAGEARDFVLRAEMPTHVALDVDVVDPREVTSVACPLPGGPSLAEIERVCKSASGLRTLSVAEFAPTPGSRASAVEAYALTSFLLRVVDATVTPR